MTPRLVRVNRPGHDPEWRWGIAVDFDPITKLYEIRHLSMPGFVIADKTQSIDHLRVKEVPHDDAPLKARAALNKLLVVRVHPQQPADDALMREVHELLGESTSGCTVPHGSRHSRVLAREALPQGFEINNPIERTLPSRLAHLAPRVLPQATPAA